MNRDATVTGLCCKVCSKPRRVGWVTCGNSTCQQVEYLQTSIAAARPGSWRRAALVQELAEVRR